MNPIFILWTRSFWLGIFPAMLTAIDILVALFSDPGSAGPVADGLASVISLVAPVSGREIEATMRGLAPIYTIIIAHQRSGAARPYTIDPRARE